MNPRHTLGLLVVLPFLLAACAGDNGRVPSASIEPSVASVASVPPSERAVVLRTAAFADIREDPVSEEAAAEFQAILTEAAGGGGMTATVMTADGSWSGAVGTADGVRAMRPDDQLAIGSVTKSAIAAQVMQLVEAGEFAVDDLATDHLPSDLDFDTNGATIRHLLGMRSGIPDYVDALWASLSSDRQRSWTSADVLELVPVSRSAAGDGFQYSSTNYVLLGLIIEQVRGRPLADVLRDGVLSDEGVERLVYQPAEAPTEPMAMPGGQSTAALETGGGYLPSLAAVTAAGPAGAMASDSVSLARWWKSLCGGDIVSEASLTEMAAMEDDDEYGLGLSYDTGEANGAPSLANGGIQVGFVAWAMCFIEDGSVVVVLANRGDLDLIEVAEALAGAARSD